MRAAYHSLRARLRHDWRNRRCAAELRYSYTHPQRTTPPRLLIVWWFCQWGVQELLRCIGARR